MATKDLDPRRLSNVSCSTLFEESGVAELGTARGLTLGYVWKSPSFDGLRTRSLTTTIRLSTLGDVAVASHIKSTNSKKHPLTSERFRGVTDRRQDGSVLATHSTGRHRNPRRNSGLTYTGVSHASPGQTDWGFHNVDPVVDGCVVYDVPECHDQKDTGPRAFELSPADVPMKVRKPKQLKARGHEVLPSVSRLSSIPLSGLGEPSFRHGFETPSNFRCNLSVFSKRAGKISNPPTPMTPSITGWPGT
ncbi:hypothetical protein BJ322DRAFT_1217689 [Thelephora terrestris]|uniref:Uncharacterized protein n=1 Tax=Thelephora terrestris TaxID=56493 RepID=A0A9P6L969_9AGAM|nr:hypothetical protein BJ322DRAFT_1217689 [Thelephora terrestris]